MKISYFREFLVLSKYLNFSLAANHLHITQPGLSRHISGLEKEIGVKLFERDTHKVRLTEKGKQFSRGMQRIIDDYDSLREAILTGEVEKITIGCPYFGVNRYLSHIMSHFESAYPKVKIHYLPAYPDGIITGLFSQQVDVAVLPRVNFRNSDKLVFQDAFKESVVILLHKYHPLATKTKVRIADLENEIFIVVKGNYGDALFENWCEFCRERGFVPPKKILKTMTIEEGALSIKPDTGVMLLPQHLKETNISEEITCIDLDEKDCSLTISLVHHPMNQNPINKDFISFYLNNSGN